VRIGALLAMLRPRSIRARIALAIGVALVVAFVLAQLTLGAYVNSRSRAEVERTLQVQADSIANAVQRAGPDNQFRVARQADDFIGDTRMVVTAGGAVIYWNLPVSHLEASATARRGDVEVLLERPDPAAAVFGDWGAYAITALGLVGVGVLIWLLSGDVARRLRRSVASLADSAEAVAQGHLDVRVEQTDDELGRLGQAFNRMTARLEAADARQREFLADIAHELRTPVTAIEGFATALADGTAASAEDRAESVGFIRAEAARLRDLVRDLQELTWLDLDPPVRSEPVDLAQAARAAMARLELDAHVRGVALEGPGATRMAQADPGHVETILSNLIANALAATGPGGSVRLSTRSEDGMAGIAVSDTGSGIAPEHLPYIFDRLYRVQSARDRDLGGSGLGLSIVKRLATLLGGRVSVESALGVGSTFTLWLPARAAAPPRRRIGSKPSP
jgi:signal transduction histidine kinase